MVVNKIISLIIFNLGGAAIFLQVRINHHIDIDGNKVSNPLLIIILRELVDLYDIFAIVNKADEHKPWAIIIAKAPFQPQYFLVIRLEIISPIWPIDE